jgi:mannose-6-phosphate isomerase-like protein (cupin superfamily)
MNENYLDLKDYGPNPFVIDIDDAVKQNNTFRTVLWTGNNFQLTVMSIPVGEEIGLEVHETGDQFIRVEEGQGIVVMGDSEDKLDFRRRIYDDYAIVIPEGKWHNIINTGNEPLKLYAIYAPYRPLIICKSGSSANVFNILLLSSLRFASIS